MCTATWRHDGGGYELFFNRDELHRRSEAIPPRIIDKNDTSFIAPIDPDGGGTWLGLNEWGVTVAILNYYPDSDAAATSALVGPSASNKSRGLLVTKLLEARSGDEIRGALQRETLNAYRPFTLLVLTRESPALAFHSFTSFSEIVNPVMPVTSSSYKTRSVIDNRLAVYEAKFASASSGDATYTPTTDELFEYHRSHIPARSAESVCMHRHDGETRSFTYIKVNETEGVMRYFPGSPCNTPPLEEIAIDLCR